MPREHWASVRFTGTVREDGGRADAARRDLEPVEAGRRLDRMASRRHPPDRLTGSRMMPPTLDPATIPGAIANRVLDREAWARQRLAAHAGRTFVIAVGPRCQRVRDRRKRQGSLGAAVGLHAGPHAAAFPARRPRVPGRSRRAGIAMSKPTATRRWQSTLKDLAPTMPWLVEQAFASVLGPIAGQRVADHRASAARVSRIRGANASATASRAMRASDPDCLRPATKAARSRSRSASLPHASTRWRRASMRSRARLPDSVVAAKFGKEKAAPASDGVGVIEHREEVARGAGDDEQMPDEVRVAQPRIEREEHDAHRIRQAAGGEQDQVPASRRS